jgi:hypothetical protein
VFTAPLAPALTPQAQHTTHSLVQLVGRIRILSGWRNNLRAQLEQEQAECHTADELAQLPLYGSVASVCFEYDKGNCASLQGMEEAEYTVDPTVTVSPLFDLCDTPPLASLVVSAAPVQPCSAELS